MKPAVIVSVLALTTSIASADEGSRDETTAYALSIGGEVASLALLAAPLLAQGDGCTTDPSDGGGLPACDVFDGPTLPIVGAIGLLVAPSLGHWYAGKTWTTGLAVRLAGVGVTGAGAVLLASSCLAEGCSDRDAMPGYALVAAGGAAMVVGTVLDFASIGDSVRARDQLSIAPLPVKDGAGLVLGGRF